MRFRERLMSKTDDEKAIIRRKNNDRAAFVNRCLKLRKEARWQNASLQEQEEMEKALHAEIMRTRYEKQQSAQYLEANLAFMLRDPNDLNCESIPFDNDTELSMYAQQDDVNSHEILPTIKEAQAPPPP